MARLDQERQKKLEPTRMAKAIKTISQKGYQVLEVNETELQFRTDNFGDDIVKYFPYSGWHTGKSIKDGRGLSKLLKQI